MYTYIMLDTLQPRYKQAVLALKASGQLKDVTTIAWESVTALNFINSHERNERRENHDETMMTDGSTIAMSVTSRHKKSTNKSTSRQRQEGHRDGRRDVSRDPNRDDRARNDDDEDDKESEADDAPHSDDDQPTDRQRQRNEPRLLESMQCFNCDKYGHLARNCRAPKKNIRRTDRERINAVTEYSGPMTSEDEGGGDQIRTW